MQQQAASWEGGVVAERGFRSFDFRDAFYGLLLYVAVFLLL
jgi:hypothetical protein